MNLCCTNSLDPLFFAFLNLCPISISPVTGMKCWHLMFLQTTDAFNFVNVIHVIFTIHVKSHSHDMHISFMLEGGGDGSGVTGITAGQNNSSYSREHHNICQLNYWIFLERCYNSSHVCGDRIG